MGVAPMTQGDRLDAFLAPGDVLCIQGQPGGIMRLGATGGYMGHVLLVTAPPHGVRRNTAEAFQFQAVWPEQNDCRVLWLVKTMESTRNTEGFHESLHLVHVDGRTGRLLVVAEELNNQFLKYEQPEKIEVWQCPAALRKSFRADVMNHVLWDMKQNEASWSWSTAVRAYLLSADMSSPTKGNEDSMMQDLQQCWGAEPICSSLIVVFWQRYLCALADMYNSRPSPNATEIDALDWILQWMPLKSDRALPGELMSSMQQCGWTQILQVPQVGRQRTWTF